MNVKLATYAMESYCPKEYVGKIGDKVCPANGLSKIGTIIKVGRGDGNWGSGKNYTVVWNTGSSKGKTSEHPGRNLVNIRYYLDAIQKHVDEATQLLNEANQFGL